MNQHVFSSRPLSLGFSFSVTLMVYTCNKILNLQQISLSYRHILLTVLPYVPDASRYEHPTHVQLCPEPFPSAGSKRALSNVKG